MGAKPGLTATTCSGILKNKIKDRGWALCIGAGITCDVFPSWSTLAERLVDTKSPKAPAHAIFSALSGTYSLDAIIEAAKNRLGLSDKRFISLLTKSLYKDFMYSHKKEWDEVVKCLCASGPGDLPTDQWSTFISIFKANYPKSSAWVLSEIICDSLRQSIGPSAILSFNAEPLLYALINAYIGCNWKRKSQDRILDLVTRSTTYRRLGRIPYYFCHGFLPVPGSPKWKSHLASPEKMVFREGEYLGLSNSVFSWQAAVFLNLAVSHSLVFVGLSFRDSNLRRWLSWVHLNRTQELSAVNKKSITSTIHYWIRTRPKNKKQEIWEESCVAHLGVRIIWLDDWSELRTALRSSLCL